MRYLFAVFATATLLVCTSLGGTPPRSPVCGRVCDATTGLPLRGVRVVSRKLGTPSRKYDPCCPDEAVTDSTGSYTVVPYNHSAAFSRPGYATLWLSWSALQRQKDPESGCVQDVRMELQR